MPRSIELGPDIIHVIEPSEFLSEVLLALSGKEFSMSLPPRFPVSPDRDLERLQDSPSNLLQEDKLRARILMWENRTHRDWDEDQIKFAQLAEKFQLPLRKFFPDDPVFGVLRRIDEERKLYPEDFQIMAISGFPGFEDRLPAIRLRQARIREWQDQYGRDWSESSALFRKLASKYRVPIVDFSPDDPTFEILTRLESGAILAHSDLQILANRGAPKLANSLDEIRIHEIRYQEVGSPGILAKIAKLWRMSGRADLGFDATARALTADHKAAVPMPQHTEAMLLTARGACLRLLERLRDARACAERAIQLSPNDAHAYCLLGAINVQSGNFDAGEANFCICEELDPRMTANASRKEAMTSVKFPSEYAAYLIDKDPYRFGWARDYL